MSVSVDLADLVERIEEFGPVAYLVTVNPEGTPHLVSVSVAWDEHHRLVLDAGSRTMSNLAERPDVSLLWPAPPQRTYALIVDGKASLRDGPDLEQGVHNVCIDAIAAVLHRIPGGDVSSPSCIRVLQRG